MLPPPGIASGPAFGIAFIIELVRSRVCLSLRPRNAIVALIPLPVMLRSDPVCRPKEPFLLLLRHKCIRAVEARQHGHRGMRLTRASMMRRRTVAIEFGTWRSGRNGGSSGSETGGYGKLRQPRGGTRS